MKKDKNCPMRLAVRWGDFLAGAAVLLLALAVGLYYLPSAQGEAKTIQIWQDGVLFRELALDRDQQLVVEGAYQNTIVVEDGKVAIQASTCPGEDCVHAGWCSQVGRSIVCLPNRVEIRVVDRDMQVDVDGVTG